MNFILTGKTNSGKTTLIKNLVENRKDCGGLLSLPVFENGKKIGSDSFDLITKGKKKLCRLKEMADFDGFQRGKYVIGFDGLKFGEEAIKRALENNKRFAIVDEIGPLEIEGKGLMDATIKAVKSKSNTLLVIRERLLDDFLKKFPERNFTILRKEELEEKIVIS